MANLGNFDSNKYEDMRTFKVIPEGEYPMQIVNSEWKENSKKNGRYLNLDMEVISGDFKGSKIWAILNLENPNEKAVEIAQKELATICRATNVLKPTDSAQLHKIPFIGNVGIRPAEGKYPESNEMIGYSLYDANKAAAAPKREASTISNPNPAPPFPSGVKSSKRPWEIKKESNAAPTKSEKEHLDACDDNFVEDDIPF